ncbi:MAG: phosphotransferase [Pyrinomonadaceae bacterium]|nr:phosphotransferase [Pyrinomonadaceae bacterium]
MIISEAAALIVERCPGWVVETIDCLGEGDFCIAYLVNDEWVFRFAKHEKAAASLAREACLLPLIANRFDVRTPSPEIVSVYEAPAFMDYKMLPGPALTQERYLRLCEPERERCARQVGEFLAQMHAADLATARRCGVMVADYAAQYRGLLARARKYLYANLAETERAFVEQTVNLYLESKALSAFEPALLHGDLSPDHVLYDESTSSVTGIIDFGDMIVGDPAQDLVLVYEDYGLDCFERFLRAYAPLDKDSLLRRVYHFYVLGAIEWAVEKAEQASAELVYAIAQLGHLKADGERQLKELLSACGVG